MRDKIAAALLAAGLWLMNGPARRYSYKITRMPGGAVRLDVAPDREATL